MSANQPHRVIVVLARNAVGNRMVGLKNIAPGFSGVQLSQDEALQLLRGFIGLGDDIHVSAKGQPTSVGAPQFRRQGGP